MRNLAIAATTFGLSAGLTWAVRYVAMRRGWLVLPRPDRSHSTPTALFGGIAIYAALVAGLLVFGWKSATGHLPFGADGPERSGFAAAIRLLYMLGSIGAVVLGVVLLAAGGRRRTA